MATIRGNNRKYASLSEYNDDDSVPQSDSTSDSESCGSDDDDDDYERGTSKRKKIGLIDISRRFEETLKYNKKEAREGEAALRAEDRQSCVHFEATVTGVEIRSHRDYPDSDRKLMWNSFAEIQANADRNIMEFKHDNWSWRDATEESEMLVQSVGELVHPASYKKSKKSAPKRKGRKKTRGHRRKGRQYSRG